jgi:hypothetical protein
MLEQGLLINIGITKQQLAAQILDGDFNTLQVKNVDVCNR